MKTVQKPEDKKFEEWNRIPFEHSPVWDDRNIGLKLEEIDTPETACDKIPKIKNEYVPIKEEHDVYDDNIEESIELDANHQSKLNDSLEHEDPLALKMYKYPHCSYLSSSPHKIKDHQLVHIDESQVKMHKCQECTFQTKYRTSLYSHRRKHDCLRRLAGGPFSCARCLIPFDKKEELNKHVLSYHRDQKIPDRLLECHKCPVRCRSKTNLRKHMLIHVEKTLWCAHCDYRCNVKGDLRKHLVVHRDPARAAIYRCERCFFETKYKRSMIQHRGRRVCTSKARNFTCSECGPRNGQTSSVSNRNEQFTSGRNYQLEMLLCSKCEMYQCDFCNYKCKQKISFTVHVLDHSKPAKSKTFWCEECDIQFKQENTLQKHLLICSKKGEK